MLKSLFHILAAKAPSNQKASDLFHWDAVSNTFDNTEDIFNLDLNTVHIGNQCYWRIDCKPKLFAIGIVVGFFRHIFDV